MGSMTPNSKQVTHHLPLFVNLLLYIVKGIFFIDEM